MSAADQTEALLGPRKEVYNTVFRDRDYHPIHSVTDLPESVQNVLRTYFRHRIRGYAETTRQRFRDGQGRLRPELLIANPGEVVNWDCFRDRNRPAYRLIFAGRSERVAFLFYEYGGFSAGSRVMVFELDQDKASHIYTGKGPLGPVQLLKDLVTRGLDDLDLRTANNVHRVAKNLVEQHGEMATRIATERAGDMQEKGDAHGHAVWLQVLRAVQARQSHRQRRQ